MDLEDWELLSDDGLLEIHDDGGKMIFSRKYSSDSKNDFNMNYFTCPSPKPPQFVDTTILNDDHEVTNMLQTKNICENVEVPNFEENMMEAEQEQVSSPVLFKKMNENEFENMKMDSPKSNDKTLLSQVEEKSEVDKEMMIKKIGVETEDVEENNGGLNLLNKSLTGIGAICSFGVAAAATICIMFIGNKQNHKQNQQLRFQIFSHDKRMKGVVEHASRLSEAISGMRGVPLTRAHITVGGYYDAL